MRILYNIGFEHRVTNGEAFLVSEIALRIREAGVRNVFPRDDIDWLRWILQGKTLRIDEPQKIKAVINKQGMNHPAFADIDLNLTTNIVDLFVTSIEEIKFDINDKFVFEPSPATSIINKRPEFPPRIRHTRGNRERKNSHTIKIKL